MKLTVEEFFDKLADDHEVETLIVEVHARRAGHQVFTKYNDILSTENTMGIVHWSWMYDWGSDPKVEEIYVTNYIPLSKLDLDLKEAYELMIGKLKDTLKNNSKLSEENEKLNLAIKNLKRENKGLKKFFLYLLTK